MRFLYNLLVFIYQILLKFVALFNGKAKQWVEGRKNQIIPNLNNKKVIWMHCSSLGEFEQGRPVFNELKSNNPQYTYVLSFFSPSGYERLKDSGIANFILYLPIDLPAQAKRFVNSVNPEITIFVKYDFWYNYLKVLNEENRKVIYISVLLEKSHRLFKSYNRIILNQLKKVDVIFTQNLQTQKILKEYDFLNTEISGDTRIDRVVQVAESKFKDIIIEKFINGNKKVLICGSTWKKDIDILSSVKEDILKRYKLVIAPHEIDKKQVSYIYQKFDGIKIAQYSKKIEFDADLLIIDKIGILSRIYRYADIAYIGGGFGNGIHNTLEPAAYHIPVIFGQNYRRFNEAVILVDKKSFFTVNNYSDLKEIILSLDSIDNYTRAQRGIIAFLDKNKNISQKIVRYIEMQIDRDGEII